jgi:hypothetical protein
MGTCTSNQSSKDAVALPSSPKAKGVLENKSAVPPSDTTVHIPDVTGPITEAQQIRYRDDLRVVITDSVSRFVASLKLCCSAIAIASTEHKVDYLRKLLSPLDVAIHETVHIAEQDASARFFSATRPYTFDVLLESAASQGAVVNAFESALKVFESNLLKPVESAELDSTVGVEAFVALWSTATSQTSAAIVDLLQTVGESSWYLDIQEVLPMYEAVFSVVFRDLQVGNFARLNANIETFSRMRF